VFQTYKVSLNYLLLLFLN